MNFKKKLKAIVKKNRSNLVIGLDSDIKKIPKIFFKCKSPVLEFNKLIIDSTKDLIAGYKINTAFYEAELSKGFETLEKTVKYIPDNLIKICDAKRGDIENTDEYYAVAFFDKMNFDAVTFQPYMGMDSALPFLKRKEKFVYVLALTSNPGSNDFQRIKIDGKKLYEIIIEKSLNWNKNNIGFVIGANHIDLLNKFTKSNPDVPLLIPGVGSQGNDLNILLKNLHNGLFLINSSRSIIYSADINCTKKEFVTALINSTNILNIQINTMLKHS
jgi:orotidine-5'-phosphate decarboxylase